jgi:uncharacterized repeat protein (TIGR03843 family)
VLRDNGGRLWAIDHGVCFHVEPKLRTVLWDFVGETVTDAALKAIELLCAAVRGDAGEALRELLLPEEIEVLLLRARAILKSKVFPEPGPGRPYPWPPI